MDYREKGFETFTKMMGEEAAGRLRDAAEREDFMSASAALSLDFPFGAVWSRPGLGMRERSIVVISTLIAQKCYPELKNHIRIGIRNGLTTQEIEEILIQAIPYCGFPAVASATGPVLEALREFGLGGDAQTPEERKML
ncbi:MULTISPECIES: carboxymuconolactone decarboxylase family protein [unclassified Sphingobium]|uniref:carboxymuconolactone decarboxylase family protein n=1 Tax=unclassified Sphingobium TaxID=2611147 RepID=UPI000D158A49|nr:MULTISPECIES: carboxymuconolactone decarboxylase family protein [unclassified Sphingobium]MBG6119980.1 4-carboxymuconolactone decarboxylase [Sphingobium sp. JAI105]PSO11853.1 carboxymuconolactone decarboxylase [Sphingobium sp. AEW4]TWC99581.1 4-carboxymuconolactone decarboxylase [Sphingobium sp. AEW010]TWD18982.1 4-carboxymuconolactone decarboxylase [Sphingobium sp. AEW013]TWD21853.1 4-carboxymuconolactone decarboxylase [Sphingobium sp. AEW001]